MASYETKKIFSENLVRLLNGSGRTQLDLAKQMEVSPSTVSSWCTADKMPRMDKVEWIAGYFGVPTSALIEPYYKSVQRNEDTIKAALWGGDKDLSQEDLDALWEDVREYAAFKAQQRRKDKGTKG